MNHIPRPTLEWHPVFWPDGRTIQLDIFKFWLSAHDGLPPYAQARIIDLISLRLKKVRPDACLWVSVQAPSSWYVREVWRLIKNHIPTAVLSTEHDLNTERDFLPSTRYNFNRTLPHPVFGHQTNTDNRDIKDSTMRVLHILARLKTAHTVEITSLAGFSKTYVRKQLRDLQTRGFIERKKIGKYEGWEIKNRGLRYAHRSWHVPKGSHFAPYRREFRYAAERHRRISRLWRSWLEAAYPMVEIWECWTEVSLHYGIPDALAWGMYNNREMIFWLEVDSGHTSGKIMGRNYLKRLKNANSFSRKWGLPIVFCILSKPWVIKEIAGYIKGDFPTLAIIGHDWRHFGQLPTLEFGSWNQDLTSSEYWLRHRTEGPLPFDPTKYPSKLKKMKIASPPKEKSNKPRFVDYSSIQNEVYWDRDPNDR